MGRSEDIIRSLFFVVLFAMVTTYWATDSDLTSNIVKTAGIFFVSAILTWVLVHFIRRRGEPQG